jgi:glycosyltransferase involved in cell wall biosynthesis
MSILINFYNQKGAGPKNIALNFINEVIENNSHGKTVFLIPDIKDYDFNSNHNVEFVRLPCHKTVIMKVLFRIYLELFFIPFLARKHNIKSFLAFGNFLFAPVKCKKTVLLHHPYLVDDHLFKKLDVKPKTVEALKRMAFLFTTKNIDTVVVQSSYMQNQLEAKFPKHKFLIEVIPNPISQAFGKNLDLNQVTQLIEKRLSSMKQTIELLYVSRFYPHKNHDFLIALSKFLNAQKIPHRIKVTIDPDITESKEFLTAISGLDTSIVNLTEIDQKQLIEHYQATHLFIFPSKAETFGNPLIEAMGYGLPILVPDLEYAHSVVGDGGLYYSKDDVNMAADKIKLLLNDLALYQQKSFESYKQFASYPDTRSWFQQFKNIALHDE